MSTTSIFFNQSFDKKKLKTFIYWVLKTFGEKEALTIVEELKNMGFSNATKAGLSIGLHDLKTPLNKKSLILRAQITMNKTDQEFQGAELTATERSQRIIDTWHRTSEDLKKEVVDYFSMYDQLNSVYMMASSGARGNFSQVRQLIGMRGLMADPQGQIISFPIRSNLREGLTLTEYFISCSGARKGLVDTALRTADTGYLTRRLVDISHHIVVKKVTCYTSRGIGLKALRTSQKVLLSLKDRLIGRVLGENIYDTQALLVELQKQKDIHKNESQQTKNFISEKTKAFIDINQASINTQKKAEFSYHKQSLWNDNDNDLKSKFINGVNECIPENKILLAKKNQEISPDLAFKISQLKANLAFFNTHEDGGGKKEIKIDGKSIPKEESLGLPGSGFHSASVLVRSPLTCAYTHEVCQLCYGWSMAQGSLVSLGEAVGVIAGQSIGEPGTQLTMRTFHTGGVFSGDLLQEIRAPHSGKIVFPQALQGLLIRTSQGKIAFLIKVAGELILDSGNAADPAEIKNFKLKNSKLLNQKTRQVTKLLLEPSTILFVRQGEKVKNNQILAELAITSEEGNQPIKSRQTLFSEIPGRVIQWKSLLCRPFEGQHKQSLPMKKNDTSKKQSDTKASLLSVRPYGRTSAKLMHNSIVISNRDTLNKIQQNQEYGRKYIDSPEFYSNSYALKLKYDCEETWKYIDNFALKKVMNLKKYGFESVEPPKALKLGLLSVISTRIGASKSKNIVTKKRVSISKNIHIKRHFLFGSSPTYLPLLTRHFSLANTTKANLLIKKKYILDKSLQKTHFLKSFNKKDKIHQFKIQKIFKHTIKRKIEDYNTLLYTYKKLCFLYAKLRYFPFSSLSSVYSESSSNVITSLKIFNQSTTLLKLKNQLKKKIPRTSLKKNNEKNNLDTPRDLIPHLNTIAEDGDLVDENYNLM